MKSTSRVFAIEVARWANAHLSKKIGVKGKRDEVEFFWPHEIKKIRVRRGQMLFPLRPKEAKDQPLDIPTT